MTAETALADYRTHRARAAEALARGDLRAALSECEAAWEVARGEGDPDRIDRAFCNRAAVAISLGDSESPIAECRRILTRHQCQENGFLAAYNIARCYELNKEPKKGLFYARIARDRADALEKAEWSCAARNQIANLLTADSFFDEAATEYRAALGFLPPDQRDDQLEAVVNIGYCEIMLGRARKGFELLFRGLRRARVLESTRLEMIARLDLCYAYLEADRPRQARRHGERGLELAEAVGEADATKNGLYLMGEVWLALDEPQAAFEAQSRLQREFYPDQPQILDLLAAVDVRPLINLRA